jgi:hypothetical protein
MSKKVHANVCALFLQPGVSTMDEILEEAAEDAEAAVESAQQHSSEDIVNVSLLLLPSPVESQSLVPDKVPVNSTLSAAQASCVLMSNCAIHG